MKRQLNLFDAPAAEPELDLSDRIMLGLQQATTAAEETSRIIRGMLREMGVDPDAPKSEPTRRQTGRGTAATPRSGAPIPADVQQVLAECTITATEVRLPNRELANYAQVKKVLAAAGGKWNTSAGAFLFKRDPREQLGLALASGRVVSTKKDTQAFYTPPAVVARCLAYAPELAGLRVLEPSAGEGAFAEAIRALGAEVVCAEIDPDSAEVLRGKGFEVREGDFLQMKPEGNLYDALIMNPPFTRSQDIKHVTHGIGFLKPGGTLLTIMSTGWQRSSNRAAVAFQGLVAAQGMIAEELEAGAFKESGTTVPTVLVKLMQKGGVVA